VAVGPKVGLVSPKALHQLDAAAHADRRREADTAGRALVGLMGRAGIRARSLGQAELEAHVFEAMNPGEIYAPPSALDLAVGSGDVVRLRTLRERLVRAPITWSEHQVVVGGRPHRVYFLEGLPDATHVPLMEALFHLGLDFRFSLHVEVPAQDRMQGVLKYFRRVAHADAHRNAHVEDPERTGRVRELNALAEVLAETRQTLVKVGAQLVLWAEDTATLDVRCRAALDHLKAYGLRWCEENGRHDVELPKSLLGLGTTFDRYKLVTSNNAVDLMPVFGASPGDRHPVLLLETPRGELYSFDPVEPARDNWNATVFGASGAGKSVWMNMLLATGMLANTTRGKVLIVDFAGETKSSYLQVAALFGGAFVPVVAKHAPVALNPFPPPAEALDDKGRLTSETLNFLVVLTDLLLTNTAQDREAQLYRTLLQRALQDVYTGRAPEDAPTYRDLARVLASYQGQSGVDRDRRAVFAELLEGFLTSPDARFFLGQGSDAHLKDKDLVIFDLFGLESLAPQIAEALTFLVCQEVKRVAFGEADTSYIILDEVAQLLRRPEMVALVDELYSTARKHRTSVWTVTQNYNAYTKSAVAGTIKLNSTTQVFLSHASAADVRAKVAQDFDLHERERFLLESLVTRKGQYSEALLRTQVVDEDGEKQPVTAKVRLTLSPFDYELATSDAADRARQAKWRTANPEAPLAQILDALGRQRATERRGRAGR
jgi:hypothetical protein